MYTLLYTCWCEQRRPQGALIGAVVRDIGGASPPIRTFPTPCPPPPKNANRCVRVYGHAGVSVSFFVLNFCFSKIALRQGMA